MKELLLSINIGLCMRHNRLRGFHVVHGTAPTQNVWPAFTMDRNNRIERKPEHKEVARIFPDAQYYLIETQSYFFRSEQLRHLRPAQFFRYYIKCADEGRQRASCMRTDENTIEAGDGGPIPDDPFHRNYDALRSRMCPGGYLPCATALHAQTGAVKRRRNRDFCVDRQAFSEPCGAAREPFY